MQEAFKYKHEAPGETPEAANDNHTELVAQEAPKQEAVEVLKDLLSPEAWSIWESLPLAPNQEAFEKALVALNTLAGGQLNYGDAAAAKRLEEEILEGRQMDATVNLGRYRVRVTRGKNGKFNFASA